MNTNIRIAQALRVIGLGEIAMAVDALASDSPEALAVAIKQGIDALPLMQACAAAGVRRPDDLIELMRHGSRDARASTAPQIERLTERTDAAEPVPASPAPVQRAPEGTAAPAGSLWARLSPDQQSLGRKMLKTTPEAQEEFAAAYLGMATPGSVSSTSPSPGPAPSQPPAGGYWSLLTPVQRSLAQRMGKKTPVEQEAFALEYLQSTGAIAS